MFKPKMNTVFKQEFEHPMSNSDVGQSDVVVWNLWLALFRNIAALIAVMDEFAAAQHVPNAA